MFKYSKLMVLNLALGLFGFVSDFDIKIWNLRALLR